MRIRASSARLPANDAFAAGARANFVLSKGRKR
jgi:hypothetical protein